jgi:hypothetical protein
VDEHYVGAVQDPSLIDTSGVAQFRLYQAYYKQDIGNTNLLVGIYDAETEFGITRPMDVFFNGAYAWTTTLDHSGQNGPSEMVGHRWSAKFGQADKWNFCLRAARMPRIRSKHDKANTADPRRGV